MRAGASGEGFAGAGGVAGAGALVLYLSGVAALGHQVIWARRLVDLLGASPETFSRVVGVFFGMMSLGAAWAAWRPVGERGGWGRVALVEGVVGVMGLVPLLGVEGLVAAGVPGGVGGALGKWAVVLVLIGVPSFAMGLVFPAVQAVCGGGSARVLYAWNTLGGLTGVVGVGFAGLPAAGIRVAGLAVCGLNLVVAVWAWRRAVVGGGVVRWGGRRVGGGMGDVGGRGLGWGWSAGLVAFGSGFGVIGGEVVMQLQYAQIAINAHQSSAAVLGFVLTGLAVGAFLAGRLGWLGRFGVAAAGVACGLEPWMFQAVRPGLELVPYDLPAAGYFLRLGLLGLGTGVVVMAVAGVVFPRLLDRASGEREVAGLLAVNGIGGWLGAEVMLERVVPVWGLWGSMVFLGVGYGVLGLVTGEGGVGVGRVGTAARLAGAMAVAVSWVSGLWVGRLPQVGLQPGEGLVEVALGREGVVATVKGGEDDWRMLMNNTYTLGGSRAWVNQERQALLPIVLHGGARRVGLLGFATGSTAAGAVADPGVERVDAYELSPLVARMAGAHFGRWNRGVMEDARLRLVVEDARIGVAGRRGEYDVVVGDLFLPWRTGEGRMYSREHFEAVRAALRGGGVFCQWLPLFQLTRAQYEAVLRTFLRVFPEGYLVRGDFYAELPIVGLVGTADGRRLEEWDWGRVDAGCRRVRERAAGVTDPLVRWVEGVAMLVLGGIPDPGPGPVNTLANGWIEWDAGWNIVGMRQPWFIGVPWAEHARGVHRAGVAGIPGPLRRAHDAGQYLLTLEVAAVAGSPLQANLAAQLGDRLPEALREDAGASWQSWPSRVKVPAAVVKGR